MAPCPVWKEMVVVPLVEPVEEGGLTCRVTVAVQLAPAGSDRLTAQGVAPLPTALKPSPDVLNVVMVYGAGNAVVFELLVNVSVVVLRLPCATLPKLKEPGEIVNGGVTPLPFADCVAFNVGPAPPG